MNRSEHILLWMKTQADGNGTRPARVRTLPLRGGETTCVPASCPTALPQGGSESEIWAPWGKGANSPNQHLTCIPTSHSTPKYSKNWGQLNSASFAQIKATRTINTARVL